MQNMDEIYSKYGDIVYKYVFCLTGNEDITEEIVQETFVVAIKDINKFRGECNISSRLCQISKHIWYQKPLVERDEIVQFTVDYIVLINRKKLLHKSKHQSVQWPIKQQFPMGIMFKKG